MRTTIFTLITSFLAFNLFAQAPQKSFTEKLDGIKTSSKELTKNASTDNSSVGQAGEMNTSVPLVTVTSRTMSFPIELRYSSGIKVDQKSSSVGLGWIMPVGSITRDYGAYEPDYSSTYHEADMFNSVDENSQTTPNKGQFATINGTTISPSGNHQYLGYDAIENVDARSMPLSDKYHIQVPGALSNTFWNGGSINGSHVWKLTDVENWKINHTVKTYTISQEFSRINEVNLNTINNVIDIKSSYASAIGVLPYVKNGFAVAPVAGSTSFNPSENESVVRYEDFETFVITDDNGTRYVFGRALRGQKFVFSDDPYWSNKQANGVESPSNGNFWKVDYIAEWLLTEIQSVDYVDLNNNGIADDGDAGDWMRFEYTEPTKVEETSLVASTNNKLDQQVPMYREWSSFSQTDRASSLMRELAYLQKIVTPTQTIDFTISERYDVEHDYYTKPANRVGNSYYYENRKYVSTGSVTDFDIEYPVETMKYDSIKVTSKLIDTKLYTNENPRISTIVLNYAEKGSAEELAVSNFLIRNNNKAEKLINGQPIGKPSSSSDFTISDYNNSTDKRGKTTLIGIDFFGSDMNDSDKNSYSFEYGYNPSYDEIHKREIVQLYHFPSLRQGSSEYNIPQPLNKADHNINYQEKRLSSNGVDYTTPNHSDLSPYDFLLDFPYQETVYKFDATTANINDYATHGYTNEAYSLIASTAATQVLKPIKDVYGYLYAENCTTCASAWSLTKITYPTGGQVAFEYEQGTFTTSSNWNLQAGNLPIIKEYNELAKKRSYVQDAYNRYFAATYALSSLNPKKLTASFDVPLPTTYGIRLKSKTIDDRLNPTVTINYEYTGGQLTALPSEYIQAVVGGFNQFIIRENNRHDVENGHYLASMAGTYTYDFQEKMSYLAHTNIALDDYSSTYFYSSIITKYADNSFTKTIYGPLVGNTVDYPVYNLFCFRLPLALRGIRLTLAGDNLNRIPITVIAQEMYEAGASLPYQKENYTYERVVVAGSVKALSVEYQIGTNDPNTVKLWNNNFEIYTPDIQGQAQTFAFLQQTLHSELYLPYNTNDYSYDRWGQFKMLLKKKVTNYKGMIAETQYTYDASTFVLREEKSFTQNEPNTYFTRYEYAFETYSTLTTKFSNLNLLRLPSKTTTYLNSVVAANALSASVVTYDYAPTVPKMLDTYQYETANINHATGTFTLPSFDPTQPEWRISESDVYLYNRTANPVSTRSNQLFTKTVVGNGLNTTKAVISSPERKFDATYTGFEDYSVSKHISDWTVNSYLDEEWLTPEKAVFSEPAVIVTSGSNVICANNSVYGGIMRHAVTIDNTVGISVGDEVELMFDYNNTNYNLPSYIAAIYEETVLPSSVHDEALAKMVCFSTIVPIPAVDPFIQGNFTNVTLKKVVKTYRLSSTYSRTGNYSYKLPTIRNTDDTPKKTPIRPVKIEQQVLGAECMVGQNPNDPVSKSTNQLPASCYTDYQASIWLKYDSDIPASSPASVAVVPQSDDVSADGIYRRGEVNITTNQGVKIICDVWNAARTQVVEQFVFYAQNLNSAWQQFTVDIPIHKGTDKWLDVYVENNLSQVGSPIYQYRSVFADDILVYPKDAKYIYTVYDKFGNSTYTVNNDDVFTQTIYDVKGRLKSNRNAYGRTVSEINYFDHPNWLTAHNHLTQRQWIANGHYNDTRFYIDGFGKTKQAVVADVERNSRIVSETNVFNNKGQVYRSYKPYALQGGALDTKYDGGFATQTAALYGSDYAYTEVTFETKPDEKMSAVSAPRTNSESAIVSTQSDYVNTTTLTYPIFINSNTYPAGTLIVHELINPLGKKTKTYIDNLGRVLMEEHEIGYDHQQNADGSITILNTGFDYARTWFVYDGAGRIIATYDPSGKKTEYFYNSLGLVVKSISPDKGMSEMRYDKYGQVRFVKNARDYEAIQANNYGCDQFKYMKYDKWGRVTETGVLTVAPNSLGGSGGNQPFPTDEFFDEYAKINNQEFPSTTQKLVQVHTKTTYDGMRITYNSSQVLVQTTLSDHTFNTTTYLYTEGKTDMVDFKYMADGQVSRTNYNYEGLSGSHEIAMVYNELRVPIGKDYKNSLNAGANFKWRSTLDNFGRTTRSNSIHNNINTQTAQNYYDAVGNLLMVGVGTGVGANNPHIDYQIIKKDIREQVVSQMGNFFRVGLTYNAGGNITNQYWSSELFDPATSSSSNINQYAYTYDKMNRLIGADYKQSTLNSNPFDYFDALSGNFPNDFSCFVNESDVVNFLAPLYNELQDNIDNGRNVDQSTDALAVVNQLQADYVANNIAFATMGRAQKDKFLGTFFDNCISLKLNIAAFEIYQANKVADKDHVDSLERYGGITVTRMKYITLLLGNFPFISNQDCVPNPNATAYGYLPDFESPTASTNATKYDAAYWYTDNGNITQLNRNDETGLKTIQAYAYSNALNNKLTGVTWTVAGNSPFTHNYGYDASGNLLTDPRNQVTAIDYSLYNDMPKAITQNGDTHTYRYFGGQRSVKVINDTDREYYIDEIVLAQNGTVKSYQTTNGYATPNTSNGVDYFYNVKDWLGTNRVVIDATGTIVNASDTYPYGKKLPGRNQFNSNYEGYRYQFTGHETDGETGYQYHGARYYNEELARFLSTDPWENKYPQWSTYNYCMGNPILLVDPTGKGPTTHVLNKKTGESVYIEDGSDDIVVVSDEEYMKTVQTGLTYEGYLNGDNFDGRDEFLETSKKAFDAHLAKGVRHTQKDFDTGDATANENIASLDPRARMLMVLTVLQARIEGLDVRGAGLGGYRTYAEQNALYEKGRSKPGKIVTKARGGYSNHNFGLSMDVAIYENGEYLRTGSEWQYERFGEIAEFNGLEWGGRWTDPFDPAHVQIKHGYTMAELRALPKDKDGYIIAPIIKGK